MEYQVDLVVLANLSNKQLVRTKDGISHTLASHYQFEDVKINKSNTVLIYEGQKFHLNISQLNENIQEQLVFQISMSSNIEDSLANYSKFEKVLNIVINKLSSCFTEIHISRHDISKKLCIESYEHIYTAENILREFIIKFMLSKIGSDWWSNNLTDSNIKKAKERESNYFNNKVNENIYNIDFKDLSEVIFNNHSQFKTKTAVLNALRDCSSLEDFKKVKEKSISNWDKYFSELFDDNWNDSWKELAEYRNRIAHNKIINTKIHESIKTLSSTVVGKISEANRKINDFKYSSEEIHVIRGEILQANSFRLEGELRKLTELGYNLDDIYNTIYESISTDSFTSAEVIRALQNDKYYINESINKTIGFLLSQCSDKFKIESIGESMTVEDNNGNKTSLRIYKKV